MRGLTILELYAAAVQFDKENAQYFRNFTSCGECSNCGSCCSNNLPVSAKDSNP